MKLDLAQIGRDLDHLEELAAAAGADPAWLASTIGTIVRAVIALDAYQAGDHDPRRRRSLELALRVSKAAAAGASVALLAERFGISHSQVFRLKALVARHHARGLRSNEPSTEITAPGGR